MTESGQIFFFYFVYTFQQGYPDQWAIHYVELYFGTYEVYRVEISKQTYKGELNRFLFDRYICESQAFTDISVK